jgi:hypothetical protein
MALDTIPKQEGGKLKAVASGTLPSGVPVVVNSDGTVSVIASSSQALGPQAEFESAGVNGFVKSTFDSSNGKVVVIFRDSGNANYGRVVVGTVSGTSISFGTPVTFVSSEVSKVDVTFDSNSGKVVIGYRPESPNQGYAIVGTVSGTSISFGSPVVFDSSSNVDNISTVFDSSNNKVVISYKDPGNSYYSVSIVGTVSGTSISFGTPVVFTSNSIGPISSTFDSTNNKVVIAWTYSNNAEAIVGTVSGTSISFGSVASMDSSVDSIGIGFDSTNGKVVAAYRKNSTNKATAIVGTVSGTSISFGTPVVFEEVSPANPSVAFDQSTNKIVIAYAASSAVTAVVGVVSGTSISFNPSFQVDSYGPNLQSAVFDSTNNKIVISYQKDSASGKANVLQNASTNLTSENYIGMSEGVVAVEGSAEQEIGTPAVFEAAAVSNTASTFDSSNNKVVIAYSDNGNSFYGTALVGTVSGTSISFGSPAVFETAQISAVSAAFDSNSNRVVIAYRDEGNSSYGTAVVGTVSGTSISFGTPVVFESSFSLDCSAVFDSNSNKIVIAYREIGGTARAVVGTVSGTSISFGTPVVFESSGSDKISTAFDTGSNKVVVSYRDASNSYHGTAIVGTVSGTSISFGTAVVFDASEVVTTSCTFDSSNNKVVIAYGGNPNYGTAIVGTISGTSISFGSSVVFESASVGAFMSTTYDATAQRVVISYKDEPNFEKGTFVVGEVSGTSISFGTPALFEDATVEYVSSVYDSSAEKVVIAYEDKGNSEYGTANVVQPAYTNLTRGSVADGDTATIDIVGTVSKNQVGLTPGQQYYVQTDGTVGTTPADPSVLAGTAVSATKMVVKS